MHIFKVWTNTGIYSGGGTFAVVPPPLHLAITPSPLTITVIQTMMWSIDYINPLSTANLNASCLH